MYQEELITMKSFLKIFKKEKAIKVGQIGIYQDILTLSSYNDDATPVRHHIFVKIRAIGVYDNLIEIEVIDIYSFNTISNDFKAMAEKNIPKYVLSKYIKWEK
jgi:hypothetical protein